MSLIAAYTFNEQGVHDYSGNKHHLTNNGATFSLTTSSAGIGYDVVIGASNFIHTTSFSSLLGITSLSVFAYFNGAAGDKYIINNSALSVFINGYGKCIFTIVTGNGTFALTSAATFGTSTWYALACVYDGTSISIYIDGTLDSSLPATGTMTAGDKTLYITLQSRINVLEIHNRDITTDEMTILGDSPGGILYTVDSHNFAIGDLIADESVQTQAVVSWIVDTGSFYAYPLVGYGVGNFSRYGNIYSSVRQNCFEINNDFDGHGNSQLSIKTNIASFSDYNNAASQTWDYRGFNGLIMSTSNTQPFVWVDDYYPVTNKAGVLTSIFNNLLKSQMIKTNGTYLTYSCQLTSLNNSNTKTVTILFQNIAIKNISLAISTSNVLMFDLKVKAVDIYNKKATWYLNVNLNGTISVYSGEITADFNKDGQMLVQVNSAGADVTGVNNDGIIYPVKALL